MTLCTGKVKPALVTPVLSGTSFMLCSQAEQPFCRGLGFRLRDAGAENHRYGVASWCDDVMSGSVWA